MLTYIKRGRKKEERKIHGEKDRMRREKVKKRGSERVCVWVCVCVKKRKREKN